MEMEVIQKRRDMEMDKVSVIIESRNGNEEKLEGYIKEYNGRVQVIDGNIIKMIPFKDVLKFYCNYKTNYCKTAEKTYVVRKPLYELEKLAECFTRSSKKTVVNLTHVTGYESTGFGGFIALKLDDGTEEVVARRRKHKVLKDMKAREI